jgi:hypothetical protein
VLSDRDLEVVEFMRKTGGGFVSRLAEAWARADNDNEARLRAAFPEIWAHYSAGLDEQRRLLAKMKSDGPRLPVLGRS